MSKKKEDKNKDIKANKDKGKEKDKDKNKNAGSSDGQKKIKKKRGRCFNCCMSFLIFQFVCVCLIVGLGWFFGDQYAKQQLGMSLTQTFGVVRGITRSNGDFIDNAYTAQDEAGFYDALGDALLLKKGALDGEELKETVINGINGEGDIAENLSEYLVDDVFTRENLNQTKINNVEDGQDFNLTVTDKQLATFLNGIVSAAVDTFAGNALKEAGLEEVGVDAKKLDLKGYVKLDQIKLTVENRMVNGKATNVNMATVTVSINFSKILGEFKGALDVDTLVDSMGVQQSLAPLVKFGINSGFGLVKFILPSQLYLTIKAGLSHNVEPQLQINNMDETNMDRLYSLLKIAQLDLKSELNNLFVGKDGAVKNALDEANKSVDLSKVLTNGGISCDIYQLIIDIAGLNKDDTQDPITSTDIVKTLQLILSDNSDYLESIKGEDYSYKSVKFKTVNGELQFDGEPKPEYYVTTPEEIEELLSNYEQLILSKFSRSYGFDSDNYDFKDIIDAFSGDDADSSRAIQMFDPEKIQAVIRNEIGGVVLDSKMLGALFTKMLSDDALSSRFNTGAAKLSYIGIEFIYLSQEDSHNIFNVGLNINIGAIVRDIAGDIVARLVNNLMPDNFIIKAGVDITLNKDENFEYRKTEIEINGKNVDVINKLLAAFGALGEDEDGNKNDLASFIEPMFSSLRNVIENMNDILPGLQLLPSELKLPSIYGAISAVINQGKDKDGDDYISEEVIEDALELLIKDTPLTDPDSDFYFFYAPEYTDSVEEYYQKCENALMAEFKNKYGLSYDAGDGSEYTLKEVLSILGIGGISGTDRTKGKEMYDLFDSDRLEELIRTNGDWKNNLKVNLTNTTYIDNHNATSGDDMITALIKEVISGGDYDLGTLGEGFNIGEDLLYTKLSKEGDRQFINIFVKVVIRDMVPESGDDAYDFMMRILPSDPSLISLKVDITSGQNSHAKTEISFNNNSARTSSLLTVLEKLGIDLNSDLNFETVGDQIRDAIDALGDKIDVEFSDSALILPNVFAVINSVAFDEKMYDDDGDRIKAALYGVYETSDSNIENFENEKIVGTTESNEDYSAFMTEIKDKYFLVGAAADIATFDELYTNIRITGFNADMVNVSGENGLAYTTRPIKDENDRQGDLTPFITLGDLGAIVYDYLQGDMNVDIHSLKIEGQILTIFASVHIEELFKSEGTNVDKLVNVKMVYAKIVVDLSDDSDGTYNCEIVINEMATQEQQTLLDVIDKLGAGATDMSELNEEVGKAIYDALNKLNSSYNGHYAITDNGIELCDMFTFLQANILGDDEQYDAEVIKGAIQGMYANSEFAADNTNNYVVDDIVRNSVDETSLNLAELIATLSSGDGLSDKQFGAYIGERITSEHIKELLQFNILASGGDGNKQRNDRDYLNGLLDNEHTLIESKTYIAMTILADTSTFGEGIEGNSIDILPSEMYVTFILEFNEDENKFYYYDLILNGMNSQCRDALIKLTGLSDAMNNLISIADTCISPVNTLLETIGSGAQYQFVADTDNNTDVRGRYKSRN